MSQKFVKLKNNNSANTKAYGKYFATAVYDNHFVGTDEIADFIQRQASVKKSDIKAVLQELGEAMKHFFEMGQKIKLEGIGILKVGFSSIGVAKADECSASTITTRRILFQPETERVVVGQQKRGDGTVKQKYVTAISLLKDVVFEEIRDASMKPEPETETSPYPSPLDPSLATGGTQEGGGSVNQPSNGGNTGGGNNDPIDEPNGD